MKKREKRSRSRRVRAGKNPNEASDDVRIYISPVMFIMAIYFVAMGMAYEFFCSLAAVFLHECAHAKVAKKLGYELNVIKLMPYGAALCGDADMRPKHEIAIALAGPLFNIVFATAFAAMWWLVPSSYIFTEAFCKCNLYIGLFNMLPVYPLDGGRVALALLSFKLKRGKAYKIMRVLSAVFGVATIGAFAATAVYAPNICLLSVGLFMLASAFIPDRRAKYSAIFSIGARRERLKNPIEVRTFAVTENAELSTLCGVLDPDRFSAFDIISETDSTVRGRIDESELIEAVKTDGYSVRIGDVVERKKRNSFQKTSNT